jgi:hypothetical protein
VERPDGESRQPPVPRLAPQASGQREAPLQEERRPGPEAAGPWLEPRGQADWPELRVRVRLSPGAQLRDGRRGLMARRRARRGAVGLLDAAPLRAA